MIIMSDDDVLDDDYNNHNDQGRDSHAPIYADAHHPQEMVKKSPHFRPKNGHPDPVSSISSAQMADIYHKHTNRIYRSVIVCVCILSFNNISMRI